MRRIWLAALAVLALSLLGYSPPVLPITAMAPGYIVDPTLDVCNSILLGGGTTGTVTIGIIWYNSVGHPWSGAQQTLVTGMINGLAASPFGTVFQDYPQNTSGGHITGFTISATDTVSAATYGTTFNCNGSFSDDQQAVYGEITASRLPSTLNIYLVLPSYTDVTFADGAGGCNSYTVSSPSYQYASVEREVGSGLPSPNSDPPFDVMILNLSHELTERMLVWQTTTCTGENQIMDPCAESNPVNGATHISALYIAPNGQGANYQTTCGGPRCDFLLQDTWINYQGGYCYQGQAPPSMVTWCVQDSDCGWSRRCRNFSCGGWSCSDGIKNGSEVDKDCGTTCGLTGYIADAGADVGPMSTANCASGKHCLVPQDCVSGGCTAGVCN